MVQGESARAGASLFSLSDGTARDARKLREAVEVKLRPREAAFSAHESPSAILESELKARERARNERERFRPRPF